MTAAVHHHAMLPPLLAAALFLAGCGRPETAAPRAQPAPPAVATTTPIVTTASGVEMVRIPAGRFRMGSTAGESDEAPPHEVWIDALLVDRYEVTQEQYGKLVRGNPSHFKGPRRPMEQISWADAALYCNTRSRAEGFQPCYNEDSAQCDFRANGYRLPTEAEWEYACRAGSDGEYPCGDDPRELGPYAWFHENAGKTTHPVGQKKPNAWGLYDMLGNVAEWCNDVYREDYYRTCAAGQAGARATGTASATLQNPRGPAEGERYVLRGGAWNCAAKACRPAHRVGENPGFQDTCFARDAIGFRCVRKAP
jgi:formylglycine-generating enzyme required for sulfatase activity